MAKIQYLSVEENLVVFFFGKASYFGHYDIKQDARECGETSWHEEKRKKEMIYEKQIGTLHSQKGFW